MKSFMNTHNSWTITGHGKVHESPNLAAKQVGSDTKWYTPDELAARVAANDKCTKAYKTHAITSITLMACDTAIKDSQTGLTFAEEFRKALKSRNILLDVGAPDNYMTWVPNPFGMNPFFIKNNGKFIQFSDAK